MRVVVAPDSFKECLSAREVAEAVRRGVSRVLPEDAVVMIPMADGGEGTAESLVCSQDGDWETVRLSGPFGEPVSVKWGLLNRGRVAVLEMAAVAGLALVPAHLRDPMRTTTRGVGEWIRHVMDLGIQECIIGVGGSATNDGGAGMAQALGYRLLDEQGKDLPPGGAMLANLDAIDSSGKDARLDACRIRVACDVNNVFYGPEGASCVYAAQKGATAEQVTLLDQAMARFAVVIERTMGIDLQKIPGSGAAGGLAGGLVAFAGATICPGGELVAEACHLERAVSGADLVITGEGSLDSQTPNGKTPAVVARIAHKYRIPVIALVGMLKPGYEQLYTEGLTAAFSVVPGPVSREYAIVQARKLLEERAEAVIRLFARGEIVNGT